MGRKTNASFTTITESGLGKMLNLIRRKLEQLLEVIHGNTEEQSDKLTSYAEKQLRSLLDILEGVEKNILPNFENGKKPNFYAFYKLYNQLQALAKEKLIDISSAENHYSILLNSVIEEAINDLPVDISDLKATLKNAIVKKRNDADKFDVLLKIPFVTQVWIDKQHENFDSFMDGFDFSSCLKKGLVEKKALIAKLKSDYAEKMAENMKVSLLPVKLIVAHPVSYELISYLLLLINGLPEYSSDLFLDDLLSFFEPEALNINLLGRVVSLAIDYPFQMAHRKTDKDYYTFSLKTKEADKEVIYSSQELYANYRSLFREDLLEQLQFYRAYFLETPHVQNEMRKEMWLKMFFSQELKSFKSSEEILKLKQNNCLLNLSLPQQYSEKLNTVLVQIAAIDEAISTLKLQKKQCKKRLEDYSGQTFAELTKAHPDIFGSLDLSTCSVAEEHLPDHLITDQEETATMDLIPFKIQLDKELLDFKARITDLKQPLLEKKEALLKDKEEVLIAWKKDAIEQQAKLDGELLDNMSKLTADIDVIKDETAKDEFLVGKLKDFKDIDIKIEHIKGRIKVLGDMKFKLNNLKESVEKLQSKMDENCQYPKILQQESEEIRNEFTRNKEDKEINFRRIHDKIMVLEKVISGNIDLLEGELKKADTAKKSAEIMHSADLGAIKKLLVEKEEALESNQLKLSVVQNRILTLPAKLQKNNEELKSLQTDLEASKKDLANAKVHSLAEHKENCKNQIIKIQGNLNKEKDSQQKFVFEEVCGIKSQQELEHLISKYDALHADIKEDSKDDFSEKHEILKQIDACFDKDKTQIPFSEFEKLEAFKTNKKWLEKLNNTASSVMSITGKKVKAEPLIPQGFKALCELLSIDEKEWWEFRNKQHEPSFENDKQEKIAQFNEILTKKLSFYEEKQVAKLKVNEFLGIRAELIEFQKKLSEPNPTEVLLVESIEIREKAIFLFTDANNKLQIENEDLSSQKKDHENTIEALEPDIIVIRFVITILEKIQKMGDEIDRFDPLIVNDSTTVPNKMNGFYQEYKKLNEQRLVLDSELATAINPKVYMTNIEQIDRQLKEINDKLSAKFSPYAKEKIRELDDLFKEKMNVLSEIHQVILVPDKIFDIAKFDYKINEVISQFELLLDVTDKSNKDVKLFEDFKSGFKAASESQMIDINLNELGDFSCSVISKCKEIKFDILGQLTSLLTSIQIELADNLKLLPLALKSNRDTIKANQDKLDKLSIFIDDFNKKNLGVVKSLLERCLPDNKNQLEIVETLIRDGESLYSKYNENTNNALKLVSIAGKREELVATAKTEIGLYWEERSKSGTLKIKDMMSSADYSDRMRYTTDLQNKLGKYANDGESHDLFDFLKSANRVKFSGRHMKPLLCRILTNLRDFERQEQQNINHGDAKAVLEFNSQNLNFTKSMTTLYSKIEVMNQYGAHLVEKGIPSGQIAVDLSEQLKMQVDRFLINNREKFSSESDNPITNAEIDAFKEEFSELLHSQDDKMADLRSTWLPITVNILACVFTLAKLLTSKYSQQGYASFFMDKTQRLKNVESIDETLTTLQAPT